MVGLWARSGFDKKMLVVKGLVDPLHGHGWTSAGGGGGYTIEFSICGELFGWLGAGGHRYKSDYNVWVKKKSPH